MLLSVKNISKEYNNGITALKNVSFDVEKGEFISIIGPSGSGKSTLLRSINKMIDISQGSILFENRNIEKLKKKEIELVRREIGMIFQNPLDSLNPVFKVGNQVQEAIMLDKVNKVDAWNRVIDLFKQVKMPDAEERANSFPHELSGGMRQRVMIAMMLSRNPELLIADEPTTALDVTIEAQILDILKHLKNNYNTAIMLITHNFGLVAEIADKIGVMYAGEIIEMGDVYEIFKNPIHPYTKLLMQALPRITKNRGRLTTIEGSVPRITEKKEECRFANRCPYSTDRCRNQEPPLVVLENGHSYRCFELKEV